MTASRAAVGRIGVVGAGEIAHEHLASLQRLDVPALVYSPSGRAAQLAQETGNDEVDSTASEIACSWRGGGDPSLRCASYESTTGSYKADRSTWTCEPTVANGEICNTTVSCADGICDPGDDFDKFVCEPVLTYFNKFACSAHVDP